ncbi:MAG TPA: amidohydrolase [Deltaproteobacteria bacterium]|nr:amidohydrolase [Deltaproteobacteria bacterium]
MPDKEMDIVIAGGTLVTMSADAEIIENGFVGIKDGLITRTRPNDEKIPAWSAKETIDGSGCIILPGLVNTHTHLPMVCFRGMADDLPLMEWLNNHIFPAEAKHVNKEMVYAGAVLAMAEMILSGTTTFCDAYFFESAVAEAALACGMRAVAAQGFADFATPDNPKYEKMMAAADRFVNRWKSFAPMITPAFFCHSPYTCSPKTLVNVKTAAREAGILYLTHLLENQDEIKTIEKRYGKNPVRHLYDLGVLDDWSIAVHCNWLTKEDMEILADTGVGVSHNPESSMKLAAGIAPVAEMLRRGINVGLGTDGCASNNDLDMFREMDSAAKIHKVISLNPTLMSAQTVLQMATIGGARLLNLDNMIGSIEEGKRADIIMIDVNQPHLTPLYNCHSQLVYAARGADVKTSIINGKIVMNNRKLLTIDLPKAMETVNRIAEKIISQ